MDNLSSLWTLGHRIGEPKGYRFTIALIGGACGSDHRGDFGPYLLLSAINSLTYLGTYAIDIACKKLMLAPSHHLRKNICAN